MVIYVSRIYFVIKARNLSKYILIYLRWFNQLRKTIFSDGLPWKSSGEKLGESDLLFVSGWDFDGHHGSVVSSSSLLISICVSLNGIVSRIPIIKLPPLFFSLPLSCTRSCRRIVNPAIFGVLSVAMIWFPV